MVSVLSLVSKPEFRGWMNGGSRFLLQQHPAVLAFRHIVSTAKSRQKEQTNRRGLAILIV